MEAVGIAVCVWRLRTPGASSQATAQHNVDHNSEDLRVTPLFMCWVLHHLAVLYHLIRTTTLWAIIVLQVMYPRSDAQRAGDLEPDSSMSTKKENWSGIISIWE